MSSRCTVEAPDAFAAFVLARRIDPLARGVDVAPAEDGAGFCVSLEADGEALAHLLRVVQAWLDEERIGRTTVRYAGREQLLEAA